VRQYRSRLSALHGVALIFTSACLASDERSSSREPARDAGVLDHGDEDAGAELPGGLRTSARAERSAQLPAAPALSSTSSLRAERTRSAAAAALADSHRATTHDEDLTRDAAQRATVTYLKPSTNEARALFGNAVAASGDTIVVGAVRRYDVAGAAYVFVRGPSGFRQEAELRPNNPDSNDGFGWNVAISGDTIVVGANRERSHAREVNGDPWSNDSEWSGAAYVFTRSAGIWTQQAYLKASGPAGGERFGTSVAIDGDTVAVSAIMDRSGVPGDPWDRSRPGSGAVYVFTRDEDVWSQQAYLKTENPCNRVQLGHRLALSGDTLVASAWNETGCAAAGHGATLDAGALTSGAAYVFGRVAGAWTQEAHLTAANADAGDRFGVDVAIAGDLIAVGAPSEDSSSSSHPESDELEDSGAVYLFARTTKGWGQTAYLKASNADAGDYFGDQVDFDGSTLAVGAWREASAAHGVDGDHSDDSAPESGAVYLFRREGSWSERAYLKAPNGERDDAFGSAVVIAPTGIVVGARGEDSSATTIDGDASDDSSSASGAAYVFAMLDGARDAPGAVGPRVVGARARHRRSRALTGP
jgi:hypothetical protein